MSTNKTYDETTFLATGQDWAGGGSVTVKDGAIISVNGDFALDLSDSPWKIKVDGTVQSNTSMGIFIAGTIGAPKVANSSLTVGVDGTVWGAGAGSIGLLAQQMTDVINSGVIHADKYGIFEHAVTPSSSKSVSITNNASGAIEGSVGIYFDDANHDLVVKNAGNIGNLGAPVAITFGHSIQLTNSGNVYGAVEVLAPTAFSNKITNSGVLGDILMFGDSITLGTGNDTVGNTGRIYGDIVMGGGNDTVTNGGRIADLAFGGGNDKLTNTGTMNSAAMDEGNNSFVNGGTAQDLTFGSGNDTVANTGHLQSVNMGPGNNKLTNTGTIAQEVRGNIDADTVTNSKTIEGPVDLGAGHNNFTNSGTLASTLDFAFGDDIAKNTGSIAGAVHFGGGKDTFTNGGTLESTLTFGDGDDVFKNTGTVVGALNFGKGNNTLTNSGDLQATVTFGSGNDVMNNSADLRVTLVMGDGNNSFINTGALFSGISFGTGNDLFKSTQSMIGTVVMGGGNDTFIGGSGADDVNDGTGDDSYSLGAGDDKIAYAYDGIDTFDGGAGVDFFNAQSTSSGGLFINLDSKSFTHLVFTVAANSLNTIPFVSQVGTIKGFERIIGTTSADIIHGSNLGETLSGNSGGDIIIAGGGADTLENDNDGAADRFVYLSLTDSGASKTSRDTLTGFQTGDQIDLSALDANSKQVGNQDFAFIGPNVTFHKVAGELRTVIEGADTIIQADVNGDGKADFAIEVTGIKTFAGTDFVL
jgi:Ca2+-binding RTX toxin-like protein